MTDTVLPEAVLPDVRPQDTPAAGMGLPESGSPAPAAALPEAFRELAATSRRMCETAVDATGIAVMLEIGGINDAIASSTYGARDVHDLAERLLREVPTRSPALILAVGGAGGRELASGRLIRRGILYAAPGAFYVAIAADLRSTWAGLVVIGATATGWMASQVIGFVAYRLTERSGPANTHAVLRRAVVLVVPIAAGLAAAGEGVVGIVGASILAAQVVYAAAAAVLLFYDADHVLAYCVIPGAVVAVTCALEWPEPVPRGLPSLLTAAAALLTALAAAGAAWTVRTATAPPVRYPSLGELAGALPYLLYSVLCAAALAFRPIVDMMRAQDGVPEPGSALAVLPVVLVMGYGELGIRRLRRSCEQSASISTTLRRYRRRARGDLIRLELRVAIALAVTAAVTSATLAAVTGDGQTGADALLQSAATVALGTAFITGLVGCSFARPTMTTIAFLAAFGLAALLGLTIAPLDPRGAVGYLAACLFLLTAVNLVAARIMRNPVAVIG